MNTTTKKIGSKGFSLVEIMIAAGILSVISLAIAGMNKNMLSGQATSETKMEELEIRRIIMTNLLDQTACMNTFANTSIGLPITEIKNSSNTPIFNLTQTYGNNTLKIISMGTQDLGAVDSRTRNINLNITFQKMKKLATGGTTKTVSIQIKANATSPAGSITGCFVDTTATNQAMCVALGGTWISADNTCTSIPYVALSGGPRGIMTGTLTVPTLTSTSSITGVTGGFSGALSSPTFCSGINCKAIGDLALADKQCATGQVQVGVTASGTPNCKALQCPANQYFAGIDGSNNVICRPYPTNTCPTNQYVSVVNADGTVQCSILPNTATSTCPAGQVLQSITAGSPTCVDKGPGTTCPAGQVVTAVSSNGAVNCSTPTSAITGGTCAYGQMMTGLTSSGTVICSTPIILTNVIATSWIRSGNQFLSCGAGSMLSCMTEVSSSDGGSIHFQNKVDISANSCSWSSSDSNDSFKLVAVCGTVSY